MLKDLAREQEQNTGRVNISELSRETGLDRKTVRRYLRSDHPPETPHTRNKPSKLDPYKPYIHGNRSGHPFTTPCSYPSHHNPHFLKIRPYNR